MLVLPINPAADPTPEALRAFLVQCRTKAASSGRPQLVSISVTVDALDPLAVLESIYEPGEPHFYAERPSLQRAIAGAEVAVSFSGAGPARFSDAQAWIADTLENTIAVGEVQAPFGGPHFFTAFSFHDTVEAGEPFPAASVFVPRWQVGLSGSTTTAVANFVVFPDMPLEPLVERVWRAHAKFRKFDYVAGASEPQTPNPKPQTNTTGREAAGVQVEEVGNYRAAVARALEQIAAGELTKIVLARAQDAVAERSFHPLEMLNGLRQRFPDCYAFSFTQGRGPSFIGASPERLVRVSGGVLETEALAGSARRGGTAAEDAAIAGALLRSDKDAREQRQVLEDIVARLAPLGIQAEFPAKPQLRKLANVQHLQTEIRATLPTGIRMLDVAAALHPTPAVGGYPRSVAVPRIRGLEGFPRGLYAGALGWVDAHGGGELFVGIRSAVVHGAQARVYAGAGIVAGSTPEKEFAETDLKFRAMLDAFGLE